MMPKTYQETIASLRKRGWRVEEGIRMSQHGNDFLYFINLKHEKMVFGGTTKIEIQEETANFEEKETILVKAANKAIASFEQMYRN